MKQITITPPEGYEIDQEKSTFETIVFKEVKKVDNYQAATEWLVNWFNENREKFTVKFSKDKIVYCLNDQWIFNLDLKNQYLWCHYYTIWEVFYDEYHLQYDEIQQLIRDRLLDPLNCKGFIPLHQV